MVEQRRRLHDAVTEADVLRALRHRAEEHLGRARVAVLLQEVVLHLPHVLDAELVRELALLERVLDQRDFGVVTPRPRQLVLVEDPDFHHRTVPANLRQHPRGTWRVGQVRRGSGQAVPMAGCADGDRPGRARALDLGQLLGGEHRPQGRDRNLDLVEGWLAGGEPLQREPGTHEDPHPAPLHVLGGEADELVADPGDQRDEHDAGRDEEQDPRPADEGVHDDGDDHHREQEVRAAAHVLGAEALRRLGGELGVVLVGGDRLVLRAVVHEHALDVGDHPDEEEVTEEDAEAQGTLGHVEPEAVEAEAGCRCRSPRARAGG